MYSWTQCRVEHINKMFGVASTLSWGKSTCHGDHGYVHSMQFKTWLFCDFQVTVPLTLTFCGKRLTISLLPPAQTRQFDLTCELSPMTFMPFDLLHCDMGPTWFSGSHQFTTERNVLVDIWVVRLNRKKIDRERDVNLWMATPALLLPRCRYWLKKDSKAFLGPATLSRCIYTFL